MSLSYFVEMLSRSREVQHRYKADSLPIRIGRAYDNDIILDDPHAAAHHAVIEQSSEGELIIRDLASQGGIIWKGQRLEELRLDGYTIFRIGHTNMRVRTSDFVVDREVTATSSYDWEGWRPALVGLTLITCIALVNFWFDDTETFELVRYVKAILVVLGLGMLWCGIWAFANRLFGGYARLGRHLFVLGCGFVAMEIWGFGCIMLAYAFSWEVFTRYGSHGTVAIFAVMVFFHLLNIKPYRSRLLAVTCGILAVMGSSFMLMINHHGSGRFANEPFMSDRLPPAVRLSADRPLADFMGSAAGLKVKVDKDRRKTPAGDDEEED